MERLFNSKSRQNSKLILLLICSFLCFTDLCRAQWRDCFSYRSINNILSLDDNNFLAVSSNGTFFIYSDGEIEKLSKVNGLNGTVITASASHNNMFALAYDNSLIDIWNNGSITSLSDIYLKSMSQNKTVNSLFLNDNNLIICCDFGICVADINKNEISSTCFTSSIVYDAIVVDDVVYAALSDKVIGCNINSSDFQDQSSWNVYLTAEGDNVFNRILNIDDNVFVKAFSASDYKSDLINISSKSLFVSAQGNCSVYSNFNKVCISTGPLNMVYGLDGSLIKESKSNDYFWSSSGLCFKPVDDNNFAYGDAITGAFIGNTDTGFKHFLPSCPVSNTVGRMESFGNSVIITSGGKLLYDQNCWRDGKFSIFKNNTWTQGEYYNATDFYSILFDPYDENHFFIGAWYKGLYEFNSTDLKAFYTPDNSTLKPISGISDINYVRISDMVCTSSGYLFTVNNSENPLNIFAPDGTWHCVENVEALKNLNTGEMILTKTNQVWILCGSKGIFVWDFNNTPVDFSDDKSVLFYPRNDQGNVFGTSINSISEDADGNIWIGSTEGVGVISNPSQVFESNYVAKRPVITRTENGETEAQYLLSNFAVTAIETDGADRKWCGTDLSGVYLISADGTQQISHYNASNSPLPDNVISDICISESTGDVFFATNSGVGCYVSDVSKGQSSLDNVSVYPNPVRPDFSGDVIISGLEDQTDVRITDISGRLVFKQVSQGGKIVWDIKNLNVKRVASGVYLIMCVAAETGDTIIKKLLVIN